MYVFFRSFSRKMDPNIMKSKFRGCLLGSLMGDCLGAPYEGNEISSGDKIIIQRYFDKMEEPEFKGPFKKYTDDTAMMKSMAKFLIDKPEPDFTYLAKLFVTEYFKEPRRGYGQSVVAVFEKLRNSKYTNIYQPANEQFDGSGSYGNGGAMRIAPVALYYSSDYNNMINVARDATRITHSNIFGINGALLQCIAVQQALHINPSSKINIKEFCSCLLEKIKLIEDNSDDSEFNMPEAYQEKLKKVELLLEKEYNDDLEDEIIYTLGNGIGAYDSVGTAIFCFLKAQSCIPKIETDNIIRRTIQYAVTLGGDTDTIACMAGAIAGAYLGEEAINKALLSHCEKYDEIISLADNLYQAAGNT
ncbi:ADP-ribose glycohydrolase ARH3-like isoform X2 [Sitophilus oryzae]|uniref:ADP-ribosylhydrolase ARH3 n=1 Tax=Sitophilus oryzae TaxID=7048 RepID=A0A6J2X8R7_SITOR|nr:ADP-ribose glycohydrolase ARH3-like isoform X2 [Sitophilus oryzae]